MRLICPNCGAQYEVPDEVIPEAGRDVQCSSCGHTWFQQHPDHDPELAEDLGEAVPDRDWTPPDEPQDSHPSPMPQSERAPESSSEHDAAPARPEPRRRLDPAVADLLREEAEAEARARAAERQGGLESQQELALDQDGSQSDAAQRAREARDRLARMHGRDPEDEAPATSVEDGAAQPGSRRDLLPDIDEINSTLRSGGERKTAHAEPEAWDQPAQPSRGGFRRGFVLAVALFALATLLYVFAGQIGARLPQIAPALDGYVAFVDGLRLWLNNRLDDLLVWLESMAESSGD
ncbi:hypothetical protein E0K89_004395 [Aquicoccus sp. SCR17]|nr:hypothetical protein [Carideicomes alvinocaridis]